MFLVWRHVSLLISFIFSEYLENATENKLRDILNHTFDLFEFRNKKVFLHRISARYNLKRFFRVVYMHLYGKIMQLQFDLGRCNFDQDIMIRLHVL